MDLFWVKSQASSPAWTVCLIVKDGTDGLSETSVSNCRSMLRRIPESKISHRGRSLKSHKRILLSQKQVLTSWGEYAYRIAE